MSVDAIGPVWGRPRSPPPPHHLGTSGAAASVPTFPPPPWPCSPSGDIGSPTTGRAWSARDRTGPLIVDRALPAGTAGAPQHPQNWPRTKPSSWPTGSSPPRPPPASASRRSWSRTARKAVTSTPRAPSRGCRRLLAGGGVQTTGAGDMFTTAYVANRAMGTGPGRSAAPPANWSPANSIGGGWARPTRCDPRRGYPPVTLTS